MFGSIAAGTTAGLQEEDAQSIANSARRRNKSNHNSPAIQFLTSETGGKELEPDANPDDILALRNKLADTLPKKSLHATFNLTDHPINVDTAHVVRPESLYTSVLDWDEDDEEELETVLESFMKELLLASVWRARTYIRQCAGRLIPFKMLDVALITSAYLSLSPENHRRFATLRLSAPLSVAKMFVVSKIQNAIAIGFILASILLLCIETDPKLNPNHFQAIFGLECFCMFYFVLEIVLQRLCIRIGFWQCIKLRYPRLNLQLANFSQLIYVVTFSDEKAKRINTGVESTPQFFRIDTKGEEMDYESSPSHPSPVSKSPSSLEARQPGLNASLQPIRLQRFQFLDNDYVRWNWMIIDLIATIPFFIEVAVYAIKASVENSGFGGFIHSMYSWNGAPDVIRLLRLFRVLRLLKVGQKTERLRVIWKAVVNSVDGILLLFLAVPLIVVFFSFILFFVELSAGQVLDGQWYYADGSLSKFQSIADCFWCVVVTLTTVGYGDYTPMTPAGKVVMAIVMILSLFIIAFPLCMITMQYSHYARVVSEQKRLHKETAHRLRQRLKSANDDVAFHPTITDADSPKPVNRSIFKRRRNSKDNQPSSVETLLSNFIPGKALERFATNSSVQSFQPARESEPKPSANSDTVDFALSGSGTTPKISKFRFPCYKYKPFRLSPLLLFLHLPQHSFKFSTNHSGPL
ncbi:hypothetical protein BDR26DRAFT_540300 [Obelidium mucronatum]|nr:hypothetical protein BDR26DRAFT_540300 [Obelidium mucronatum]